MQIILEANGLWEMIEPNEKMQADNKKDKTAIVFFYQALPEEQLLQITKHKTAKAIWDALKTRHIGEERVQQARLQTLKSDFEMLHMKEDETIDTFTGKLITLVNKAASLGHTIKDSVVVRKLLNVVPEKFLQIVASIEQYSNLDEIFEVDAAMEIKEKHQVFTAANEDISASRQKLMLLVTAVKYFEVDAAMEIKEKHQVFTAANEDISASRQKLMLLVTAVK
nr:zinc finger, CCHC-type [Tanacetum cinerariifolium]